MVACQSALAPQRRGTQTNELLYNYLQQHKWDALESVDNSLHSKIVVMASVFDEIGLTCPTEPTTKLAVGIIFAVGMRDEDRAQLNPSSIWNIVQAFKAQVGNFDKHRHVKLPHIQLYPESPIDLPLDIFSMRAMRIKVTQAPS